MKSKSPESKVKVKKASVTVSDKSGKSTVSSATLKLPVNRKVEKNDNVFPVVAIGASAGGLDAVTELLKNLSATTGMAFIYVQHLSPDHKSILSSLLAKVTKMKVQVIDDTEKMKPNNVYVIPYDRNIEVTNGHITLVPRVKNKSSNLSIDLLFTSLAETHNKNVVGIVLSGNANDGTKGLKEIKLAGGVTFAQDDSAKYNSMPKSAIAEGVVDFILSPKEIAFALMKMSKQAQGYIKKIKLPDELSIENNDPYLKEIVQLLLKGWNVDYSHYKMTTIKRRMLRRMAIHKIISLKSYYDYLKIHSDELELLNQDLLINVTEFFRDTETFQLLKKSIFPKLLKNKDSTDLIRIWVAACATGEEAFSIAMIITELQEKQEKKIPFQIFASDLSELAIRKARQGEFSLVQLKNVSEKRIEQHFTKRNNKYRISKLIRDSCVFAQHNLLSDPPFSQMDFISCRNLLIYLDSSAQKKIISTFHFALLDTGTLLLGKSETIGNIPQLFTQTNKSHKIFTCKKKENSFRLSGLIPRISRNIPAKSIELTTKYPKKLVVSSNSNLTSAFDNLLHNNYMPASVVINYECEILQFRGATESYLKNSPGKASLNILQMAHIEITFELRNAIHQVIKTNLPVRKTGIEMNWDKLIGEIRLVSIEITPLVVELEEPLLVIVFTSQAHIDNVDGAIKSGKKNSIAKDRRIKKLEEELASARTDLFTFTHDQEEANELLQSANEEIVSSNEELQSLNEELETSKEEIESTNEELTTSNHELQSRNLEVEELYNYYHAILDTVHEPVVILDKNIRIRTANKSFCKMFHVTEEECQGVSLFKLGNNQWSILKLRELLEDIIPKNIRFHDFEVEHTFPVIGHKTMLLNAHRILQKSANEELIVLTITDITEVKRLAIELQVKENKVLTIKMEVEKEAMKLVEDSNKRYSMMLMDSPFAFAILKGPNMIVTMANDSIIEIWGKTKNIIGKSLFQILPELKETIVPNLLNEVIKTGIPYQGYESLIPLKRNGIMEDLYFNFVYQPYYEVDETISGVTIISYEVTNHMSIKNELQEAKRIAEVKTQIAEDALKAKQQFLSNMSHEIRTPMNAIIGFTNVILKTKLESDQKDYINAIKTSGDALVVLINDILDLAKVDAGKMIFDQLPFDLSVSIATMLQLFESKIKEKNLVFRELVDDRIPKILIGDALRLRQIILNLLSNAVKFTGIGSIELCVSIHSENENNIELEFKVSDTGIGIPNDRIEHIFNDFEQVSKEVTNSYGGTGLGLAIVKRLVELQGGKINVSSELGVGTVFSFILNFEKSKVSIDQKIKSVDQLFVNPKAEKIKVLVVEDGELNQLLIKIILEDFGFKLDIASNGKIAIEKLEVKKYDLVLMDLQMPVMNGFDATKYIREVLNSNIPIIALTADVTSFDLEKCRLVGMNDYVSKPIDEKTLFDKMSAFLQ